ncbi:sensor histidine kinase [Micromonospora sp. PLK6-60]|uniref:sensor histidine kinase n=1 Tax=Micromonospora sp. PLK6-60 TaxID=2873383 RepID=UPI001CA69ECD|nr:histidine kinase [Micromonospora sp. PLK6-60]MBY8871698.1 sensor histidine kinase [Micromonospora sp. PLK6-60]
MVSGPAVRPWLVDGALVLAVFAAAELAIATGHEVEATPRDWLAYALGLAMAAPLLLRRRYPLIVLYLVTLALLLFYALGYPGFPPALVLAAPLYFATLAGHLWPVIPVPVFFLAVGGAVSVHHGFPPLELVALFLPQAAVLAVAMLLGALVRSRRAYAAEVRHRLAQGERERELEAERRVAEERLRIAREVHDTVGHAIATITVQSAAALHLLDRDPARAREALTAIRGTGKAALAELRTTLEVLRGDADTPAADRDVGLHRLPDLLAAVRAAGLRIEFDSDADGLRLADPVDHAAYRILQESLTNVLRHAGPQARAEVRLRAAPETLTIEVGDDGVGGGAAGGGRGLAGMRERARALGGSFDAGPGPDGGFRVRAALPRGTT